MTKKENKTHFEEWFDKAKKAEKELDNKGKKISQILTKDELDKITEVEKVLEENSLLSKTSISKKEK